MQLEQDGLHLFLFLLREVTVDPPSALFFVVRNEVPSHQLSCISFDHVCSEIPATDEREMLEEKERR